MREVLEENMDTDVMNERLREDGDYRRGVRNQKMEEGG